jgi:hypothetical protein
MYNRGIIMSDEERIQIRDWAFKIMPIMRILPNGRLDYRLKEHNNDPNVIPIITKIEERLEQLENLHSFKKETEIGDFIAVVPTGGYIHKHCDPNDWENDLFHVRFNIFITLPKLGGTTYYDGHTINSVEGSYVLCRSGIDEHWSDPNQDTVPRISLSFGYLLPPDKVDFLCKDPNIGTYTNYYPLTINKPIKPNITNLVIEERGEPGSNVFTISDVFTIAQCNEIIEFIMANSALWSERGVDYGSKNNVECKFLSLQEMMTNEISGASKLDDLIFKRVNAVLKAFSIIRPDFNGQNDSGYTLRRIHGGTKRHADGVNSKVSGFSNFVRAASFIAVLNDDYDGGIFNFPAQNLKFKVKKGEVVLFPPYWTHPHSVTSVGEGQARYTINTWIMEDFI